MGPSSTQKSAFPAIFSLCHRTIASSLTGKQRLCDTTPPGVPPACVLGGLLDAVHVLSRRGRGRKRFGHLHGRKRFLDLGHLLLGVFVRRRARGSAALVPRPEILPRPAPIQPGAQSGWCELEGNERRPEKDGCESAKCEHSLFTVLA